MMVLKSNEFYLPSSGTMIVKRGENLNFYHYKGGVMGKRYHIMFACDYFNDLEKVIKSNNGMGFGNYTATFLKSLLKFASK